MPRGSVTALNNYLHWLPLRVVGVVGALVVVAGLAGFAAVKRKSVVSNPRSHRTEDEVNAQYGVGIEVTDEKPTGIV